SMTACTCAVVFGETRPGLFTTRDTVLGATPAARATSSSVTLPVAREERLTGGASGVDSLPPPVLRDVLDWPAAFFLEDMVGKYAVLVSGCCSPGVSRGKALLVVPTCSKT